MSMLALSVRCHRATEISGSLSSSQRAWFTDQTGTSLLPASNNAMTEQPDPLQIYSSESVRANASSSAVPDFGKIDLKLSELCAYVNQSTELQEARIVATEEYAEVGGTVTHRFLVLELRRHNLNDAWLRLDRRIGENTSIWKFLTLSCVTEANDEVRLKSINTKRRLTTGLL